VSIKERTAKCQRAKIDPILLAKLQKLCRLRWCNHYLPDADTGRAMLATLLRFGLTDQNAIECAPWCEAAELSALKRRARRIKWLDVGKLIGLTFKEWKRAKLFLLRPVDASDSDIQAWREERRKVSARNRQAKRREKQKREKEIMQATWQTTTPRQKAILEILIRHHVAKGFAIKSVPELMKEAKKLSEFARVKNLRDAIHETLNQLEAKHAIRTHSFRPVRMVMLDIWRAPKSASEASDSGVGLSDPAIEEKSREVNDLAKNSTCHAPIRTIGSVTTFPVSPTPSKPLTRTAYQDEHGAKVIPLPARPFPTHEAA
jgi:hypothetical protein